MRLRLLLAGLLLMLPLPAFADVTANYSAGPKDRLVIEADDGGNFRLGIGDKFAVIRRDGVDYVVVANAAGVLKVARLGDVMEMIAGQLKGASPAGGGTAGTTFELRAGAEENVAGYTGMIWLFGPQPQAPGKKAGDPFEIVMSPDSALAPIGLVFREVLEAGAPAFGMIIGDSGNFAPLLTELLAKGTPLRVGPMLKLESVSSAEIAASQFELPGEVLEPIEFLQAVMPSEGGGLPPLP